MILVDFSHLTARILHVAVNSSRPKINKATKKYNTEDYKGMFLHILFKTLRSVISNPKFAEFNDEIIICTEGGNNWRYGVYPKYKSNRKTGRDESPIDYAGYYALVEEVTEFMRQSFPVKVVQVKGTEADDIVGTLAQKSNGKKTLVVSSDKDFKQVLKYPNVQIWDPMKETFVQMTPQEIADWEIVHLLAGDAGDGIPSIKEETEFSKEFVSFLKKKNIQQTDVLSFSGLSVSNELIDEYNKEVDAPLFKKALFAEGKAKKFAENLEENLNENPLYRINLERNRKLIDFSCIPEEVQNSIVETYQQAEEHFDMKNMMEYFLKNQLREHIENISKFIKYNSTAKNSGFISFEGVSNELSVPQNLDDF